VNLLSESEEHQQLVTWNSTAASYPADKTIHQLFEEQAARRPDNVAVVYEGEQLTYRELDEQSNQLAHLLRSRGVEPETLVALCLNRSLDMVVALVAVLKAGGAYLPLDPTHPQERLRYVLEHSRAQHLVTTEPLLGLVASEQITSLILLDRDRQTIAAQPTNSLTPKASPRNLAYCLYTSGSTGKPKGVLVDHYNVVRLIVNDKLQYEFSENDVWSMFFSYCFDFSVWEMYGALFYGGKLVVVPEETKKDPAQLLDLVIRERFTVLNQTPSAFYNLANEAVRRPDAKLALRYVVCGGEAFHPVQVKDFKETFPAVKLINMYGITETTVHSTFKEITTKEIDENLSNIGVPIPTTTIYLMDSNQRLLPIGVSGEICVGGDAVTRAYLGRDDLTNARFVVNPYKPTERIYRSGDFAKFLPNGEMVYIGRKDNQVQVRGFRVEPAEVKSRLLEHPLIIKAEVLAETRQAQSTELIAYVVPTDQISISGLRNHLGETLPYYMIPSTFVMLKDIPLTTNGKVNVRALPGPEQTRPELKNAYQAPITDAEQRIATIWQEVLKLDKVGVADNFFDLGGHSLLLIQVQRKLRDAFERDLNIVDLFRFPTVGALAGHLSQDGQSSAAKAEENHVKVDEGKGRLRQLRQKRAPSK
jgi:amino acid adenylation domain-containing protein